MQPPALHAYRRPDLRIFIERCQLFGIGYAFADEHVESLTGAQKLLLRTGPRNVRIIKGRLREIGIALGIAPGRLPVH